MRRALALAAVVVSARQDHLCTEDVCFYHIPKTGGDSFKYVTTLDRHVYRAARRLFAKRVLEAEARLGRRILCG